MYDKEFWMIYARLFAVALLRMGCATYAISIIIESLGGSIPILSAAAAAACINFAYQRGR